MEVKYQIFVSSTYQDLKSAREKVVKTILSLYHFPVGMEMFSADDAEQWEVIKDTIDNSDYYIVIIGHKYGSETSDGISFTEKEFDYAANKGIPILAFIRERNVATKPEERDDDLGKQSKLNRFIEKATKSRMCDFWTTEDELASKVAIALTKIFRKSPRVGWIRGDKGISPIVSEELAKLSKENRELHDELNALRNKLNNKLPDLFITINNDSKLLLRYKNDNEIGFRKLVKPDPITHVPDHLKPYITTKQIEEYNSSLPSQDVLEEYNNKLWLYYRIKKAYYDFNIQVLNRGKAKARDIFVEVSFPDEPYICEKEDIDELTPELKRELLSVPVMDVYIEKQKSPLMVGMQRTSASLMQCFEGSARKIIYPEFITP